MALTIEELFNAATEIFAQLKLEESRLREIQKMPGDLLEKWQNFLQIILPIQMNTIKAYGFTDTQSGLSSFNKQYINACNDTPDLSTLNKQKWLFLFETAFGITQFKEISLEKARNLIAAIAHAMTDESFLTQIDLLEQKGTLIQKRKALLTILFPLHMSVMSKHGFNGDLGYIQAQRAITDYYHDAQIAKNAAHAQAVVFKRAGLI